MPEPYTICSGCPEGWCEGCYPVDPYCDLCGEFLFTGAVHKCSTRKRLKNAILRMMRRG